MKHLLSDLTITYQVGLLLCCLVKGEVERLLMVMFYTTKFCHNSKLKHVLFHMKDKLSKKDAQEKRRISNDVILIYAKGCNKQIKEWSKGDNEAVCLLKK